MRGLQSSWGSPLSRSWTWGSSSSPVSRHPLPLPLNSQPAPSWPWGCLSVTKGLERKIKSPKLGWICEGSPRTSSPMYFQRCRITARKYPTWPSGTAQTQDNQSFGIYTETDWPPSTNSTSFKVFQKCNLKGRRKKANINSVWCMHNVHLQGKSYQNTSSCSSDFQGAAMWKGSQNKSQNISPKVQVFEMPWPDQFQDWCFQGSIPRIILVTSLKIKTVIVHITYVMLIPNAGDKQDWQTTKAAGPAKCGLEEINEKESVSQEAPSQKGRKD